MWSLPDIKRLNSEAQSNRNKFKRAVRTGTLDRKKLQCEWRDHDEPSKCSGDLHHYSVYDIFSDDPKGVLTLCEHHDGYYGSPSEGYFECIDCNRVTTENYTWELYYHDTEDGQLCLPCYADRELAEPSNWIPLTDAVIDALTFQEVRKAKHLIGVQMPIPKGITFFGNTEVDGSSGGRLMGFSSCEDSPEGAVEELKETLHRAQDEGHRRAILILDAAYQFSISIGVYVPVHEPGESIVANEIQSNGNGGVSMIEPKIRPSDLRAEARPSDQIQLNSKFRRASRSCSTAREKFVPLIKDARAKAAKKSKEETR